jgi:cobalamin biosynthesis protein CobT
MSGFIFPFSIWNRREKDCKECNSLAKFIPNRENVDKYISASLNIDNLNEESAKIDKDESEYIKLHLQALGYLLDDKKENEENENEENEDNENEENENNEENEHEHDYEESEHEEEENQMIGSQLNQYDDESEIDDYSASHETKEIEVDNIYDAVHLKEFWDIVQKTNWRDAGEGIRNHLTLLNTMTNTELKLIKKFILKCVVPNITEKINAELDQLMLTQDDKMNLSAHILLKGKDFYKSACDDPQLALYLVNCNLVQDSWNALKNLQI